MIFITSFLTVNTSGHGATYHKSQEFREYLDKVNENLEAEKWSINCTQFASHAPEQNPVENVWLEAKTFIRHFDRLFHSFKLVKWLFNFFARSNI